MFSCFLPMLRFPWVSFHAFESRVFSVYRRHKLPDNQWQADERTDINNISNISPLLSVTLKLVQLEAKIFSKVNSGAAEKLYFQKLYFQKWYFHKWIGVAQKLYFQKWTGVAEKLYFQKLYFQKLYFQKLYFQKSYFQKWIGVAEKLWGKNSPISGLTSTS